MYFAQFVVQCLAHNFYQCFLFQGNWVKMLQMKSVTIKRHQIKIKLRHFCKFSAPASGATDREILAFQSPATLENNEAVYITVYAVPRHVVQVGTCIRKNILRGVSL